MSKRKKRLAADGRRIGNLIDDLVARGLAERVVVDGEQGLRITPKGLAAVRAADALAVPAGEA